MNIMCEFKKIGEERKTESTCNFRETKREMKMEIRDKRDMV